MPFDACPSERTWQTFRAGSLEGADLAALEGHASGCARCALRLEGENPTSLTSSGHGGPSLQRGDAVGRYLVVGRLGQGGMGVVYSAYDPELDRKLAIKLLRAAPTEEAVHAGELSDGQARLLREAQAMARIAHPNVLAVFDVGTVGDRVFLAMELVEGTTLLDWMLSAPRPWREVLAMFEAAGRGLAAAHAAGLVHRDFKPENVLIGLDGRPRVTDFGLVRVTAEPRPEVVVQGRTSLPLAAGVTQVGSVMGTPLYMAPEQHLGEATDARTDQFAFGVSLYVALYAKHPFDPAALAGLARRKRAGEALPAEQVRLALPAAPRLPPRTRRALVRALSFDPADRFATMEELLADLAPRSRRAGWAGAGAAALAVALVGVAGWQVQARRNLCSGGRDEVTAVWNAERASAVLRAFHGTGLPFSEDAFSRVRAAIDAHAEAWVLAHRQTCEATRLRGEQSEELLSLRMVCLERRRKELDALVSELSTVDRRMVEQATDAVGALADLRACADVDSLSSVLPPPRGPSEQQAMAQVTSLLAEADARTITGRYPAGLESARQAQISAEALRYPPLLAEAQAQVGWLRVLSGAPAAGVEVLEQAYLTAEAGRDEHTKVQAATRLVYSLDKLTRFDDALRWGRLAEAASTRAGRDPELQADLSLYLGYVAQHQQRRDDAVALLSRALAISREREELRHQQATILRTLALLYAGAGQLAKAEQTASEALELILRARGPAHPTVALARHTLSGLLLQRKDYVGAAREAGLARQIWAAALGPTHPWVGYADERLGGIALESGHLAEAVEHYQRALALRTAESGPANPGLATVYSGLGMALVDLGRFAEARRPLLTALELAKDPAVISDAQFGMAKLLARSEPARAHDLSAQARAGYQAQHRGDELDALEKWEHQAFRAGPRTERPTPARAGPN